MRVEISSRGNQDPRISFLSTTALPASESRNLSVVHRDMVSPGRPGVIREPWHAVRVVSGATACPAVFELRGKRVFLLYAPRLPLPGCARPNKCECVYHHHPDRRASPRRASDRIRPKGVWLPIGGWLPGGGRTICNQRVQSDQCITPAQRANIAQNSTPSVISAP